MYIRYPVRNFRCPFCGARVPTETYKGWKPWICPGCSAELQFSAAYGQTTPLVFFAVALLPLYTVGFRGWQLFGTAILLGLVLMALFLGPLERVLPPKLEAYRPPPWKKEKDRFVTLFPRGMPDPERPNDAQSGHEQSGVPQPANGPEEEK
jgi:hypothetical protein